MNEALTPGADRDRSRRTWPAGLCAAGAILLLYGAAAILGGSPRWISTTELVKSLAVSLAMLLAALRTRSVRPRLSLGWGLLTLAYLFYSGGDLLAALGVTLTEGKWAVVMNGCYLLFYPLFLAGVLRLPSAPLHRRDRDRLLVDMAIVELAAGALLWIVLVQPLLIAARATPTAVLLTSAFLLGDLAMLFALLFLILRGAAGRGKAIYRMLIASMLVVIATDLAYAYEILGRHQEMAPWIGLGFTIGHLLAGLAALAQVTHLGASPEPEDTDLIALRSGRMTTSLVVAHAALLTAWVAHFLSHREIGLGVEFAIGSGVILLILVRQALEVRQSTALSAELRRANVQLEAANRELSAFASSVSHDLRAPLHRMDGFAAAVLEDHGDRLGDEGRDFLTRICSAVRDMRELIDDLLRLSRITQSQVQPQEIDLSVMARRIASEFEQTAPQRRVELVIPDGVRTVGDARLLEVALENLLGNAFKFTRERTVARIELGVCSKRGDTAYFVRDNGAGFDMERAGRLFGAFQRLHQADRFEGSGVGLATVQRIIHRHGGRVWAEAAVDRGATFYFTLGEAPPRE